MVKPGESFIRRLEAIGGSKFSGLMGRLFEQFVFE
jgi:hypothetical protein